MPSNICAATGQDSRTLIAEPCGTFTLTRTSRSALRNGSGCHSTASATLNAIVVAPMPIASVSTTSVDIPGRRARNRTA